VEKSSDWSQIPEKKNTQTTSKSLIWRGCWRKQELKELPGKGTPTQGLEGKREGIGYVRYEGAQGRRAQSDKDEQDNSVYTLNFH
jgi:hypothetical protein